MQSANYTSDNIARALGLAGFANDDEVEPATQAIRLLFAPSFHAEVCITMLESAGIAKVSVVAA